jgi:hypothetical protein
MVGATSPATEFALTAQTRVFLRNTRDRYPYAYGYLRSAVSSYLDGASSAARLRAVLAALEADLNRDAAGGGE